MEMRMKIQDLNREMALKRNCVSCPMAGRAFVGAASHNGEDGHVQVLFLGLNPGVEEARIGLPFVGPSGKFLRAAIAELPAFSWAIINSILCSSPNQNNIANPDRARACCRGNVASLWSHFTPDMVVPCGNGASAVFEISDGITRAENLFYISRGRNHRAKPVLVAPIQHPSALIRSGGKSSSKWANWSGRLAAIASLAQKIDSFNSPEELLASENISWTGLFGYKGN